MIRPFRFPAVLVGVLALALAGTGLAVAARPGPGAGRTDANGTLVQVERMLRAGIGPEVVLAWLERDRPPVPRLGPDDLVRLREAGADDALLRRLIEMEGGPGESAAGEPGPPAGRAAAGPAAVARTGEVPVRVTLDYRPRRREDEEPWSLYVYVDGRPVAWSPGPRTPFSSSRLTFVLPLAPGRHLVRLARERHLPRSLGSSVYRHETRFAPIEISLAVPPREGLELLLRVREDRRGRPRPAISWTVSLGGKVLVDRRDQGPPPGDWPWLCEDLEATFPEGSRVRERRSRGCVHWEELWRDVPAAVPGRREILDELRRYGFRPVPLTAS